MFLPDALSLARQVLDGARAARLTIATVESCTGGLLAACLTEIPGASAVFERGYVTYSNRAKVELLGVDAAQIDSQGAVSEAVARAMAEGALAWSGAGVALAITGIAGPGGGGGKPVGLVHMAAVRRGEAVRHEVHRYGDQGRGAVRLAALDSALALLLDVVQSAS